MSSFTFCFIILVCIKNAMPKIYVLDLTNQGTDDDKYIRLNDILLHLKKPAKENIIKVFDEGQKYEKHSSRTKNYADCLSLDATKTEKLKCLEQKRRKDKSSDKQAERSNFLSKYHALFTRQPKRKIYSFYNYYGGLLKSNQPFTDLTRQEFSQDYLDIGDLSRSVPKCHSPDCKNLDLHKLNYLTEFLKSQNVGNNRRVFENVIQRSYSSDESSDSSDSNIKRERKKKHRKPNRFEVVFNDDSSASEEKRNMKKPLKKSSEESDEYKYEKKKQNKKSSEESEEYNYKQKPTMKSSEESEEYNYKQKPTMKSSEESEEYQKSKQRKIKIESDDSSLEVTEKPIKSRENYAYLQGNKVYDSFRRRLQHFLPKRFHWDEDDIHHLGYYWFDGPRGKYS